MEFGIKMRFQGYWRRLYVQWVMERNMQTRFVLMHISLNRKVKNSFPWIFSHFEDLLFLSSVKDYISCTIYGDIWFHFNSNQFFWLLTNIDAASPGLDIDDARLKDSHRSVGQLSYHIWEGFRLLNEIAFLVFFARNHTHIHTNDLIFQNGM